MVAAGPLEVAAAVVEVPLEAVGHAGAVGRLPLVGVHWPGLDWAGSDLAGFDCTGSAAV